MHHTLVEANQWVTVFKEIVATIFFIAVLAFCAVWLIRKIPQYRKSHKLKTIHGYLREAVKLLGGSPADPVEASVKLVKEDFKESKKPDGSVTRGEAILGAAALAIGASIGIALGIYKIVH